MNLVDTLEDLERQQWEALTSAAGAIAFYSEHLTEDSLMSVPHGIGDRDRVIGSLAQSPPILNYEIKDPHVIQLGEDSGIIVYKMTQNRDGMEPFDAAICTVYVRREGHWRIAYHQQTPLVTT